MTVLLMTIGMIIMDRTFPGNVWRFAPQMFDGDLRDVYKRYGFVSFPRTLLALCVCISSASNRVFDISETAYAIIVTVFAVLFGVSASLDVWRARKPT